MIRHYLKVAFRNMRKYRNQTLVSVVGLAVGFVCFAMSALWIRYEMTYDSFHKNADRIYCVYHQDDSFPDEIIRYSSSPLAGYLKSTFPEISNATTVVGPGNVDFKCEGIPHKADILQIDSSFFSIFDIRIVEGNMDFLIPESNKIAITRDKALQLFGNENPVGKKIEMSNYRLLSMVNTLSLTEQEICAVVTGFRKQSNYPFDFLGAVMYRDWNDFMDGYTLVELVPDIDMKAFEKKLYGHEVQADVNIKNMTLTPLTSIRYENPHIKRDVKFRHIIIFAVSGLLLILCTLFNCLTLFVSRFKIRQREFALRTVYGASGRSLFAMLSVEFLMSLIASLILGLVLINIFSSSFLKVSGIRLELSAIYLESGIYIAGIIVVALTVFFFMLMIFRRRTLNAGMHSNKKILRRTSIAVQLTVSIVFTFCTLVILKQMYFLHSADPGFSFKNRGSVNINITPEQIAVLNDKMKQIPEIKETLTGHVPLLPGSVRITLEAYNWDGKQEDAPIAIEWAAASEQYAGFYEFELIEGEFCRDDDDEKYVLINESAAKAFGWDSSVGKSFNNCVVKGVIKNIYSSSPATASIPAYYKRNKDNFPIKSPYILFKYGEGSWKTCVEKIRRIVEKEFPDSLSEYYSEEEEYNKFLKSENALLAIFTVVSLVCMTVCVFGFVSMVSLTCEERRKEIAIRKINGATVKDILDIFFKEYLTLLAAGSLTAFPAGYIIMKRWLEQYAIQTEISVWIYLSILLALITVIAMCVGRRVYRTSRENPVNAINR